MNRMAGFLVVGAVVASVYAFAVNSPTYYVLAVGLLLFGIEVAAMTRVAGGFSSALIPVIAINVVMLSAMMLWDGIRDESIVSVRFEISKADHIRASWIAIIFCAAYTVGALIVRPRASNLSLATLRDSFTLPTGPLIAIGYVGIILTIFARQDALLSGRYLDAYGPEWATGVSNALAPLAVLTLCIAAASKGGGRSIAIVGVALWVLILFSRASRSLAAVPGLLVFAQLFASDRKIKGRTIALAGIATIIFLQLPLVGRANPDGVGLIPLTQQVIQRPNELFESFTLGSVVGNVLFSGPLTAVVAGRDIPIETFWISLNPMPGNIAGWLDWKFRLRIIPSTPYNALGELGARGQLVLALSAAIMGAIVASFTRVASRLSGVIGVSASLVVFGVIAWFSVSFLQYNLRSSVRYLWYIAAVLIVLKFVAVSMDSRRSGATVAKKPVDSREEVQVTPTSAHDQLTS